MLEIINPLLHEKILVMKVKTNISYIQNFETSDI